MSPEPLPQPKTNNAVRSSSLQGTALNGKTTSAPSSHPQKRLQQQEQHSKQPESPKQLAQLTRSRLEPQTRLHSREGQQKWSLKAKATALALAASMLPVLTVGTAGYLGTQAIYQQVNQARYTGSTRLVATEAALQRQLLSLAMGTGVTAVIAGAIAAFLMNRALRPVLDATAVSTTVVNRLRQEAVTSSANIASQGELAALETNVKLIEEQLPSLLGKQEAEAEHAQTLMSAIHRLWGSLSEADVLRATVAETRTALKLDRVVVLRFDNSWNGSIIEESAAFGLAKMLGTKIDAAFVEDVEQYQNGRVQAIDNIHQAGFTRSHTEFLEKFAVKGYLSAPLVKDNQLFGLLIAHQCSKSRFWQQPEIDLFTHLAAQVGFALERARLLEQVDTKASQAQVLIDITHRIRESLNEEDILKTTVEEIRKAMRTDRVIVYSFDANWYGTVIAESVVPGFPKALWAKIKDPCFAEGYVEKYQFGRVQATNNIYEAGLTECHLQQLEPFAVKANLVAPILKDGYLFGLLIAHECSKPREWQQSEINLFAQLATQVGFALDHARLLQRIDTEGLRNQLLAHVTHRIRESLNEEDILKTTVEEIRKAVRTDRVVVYGFDADWYGTVIAESVVPGFPKALWAKIKDPCFAEGYIEKYQAGRVHAINNIYAAGLTKCYLQQLEPFAVKANLVAPILKDGRLFGLLIAHECAKPREWQQVEIDLFAQLAIQVGFALDHARLLNQVEQAYQLASATSHEQRQQKEALQRQVKEMLKESETSVKTLSDDVLTKMEFVTAAYQHIQVVADAAQRIIATIQQAEQRIQHSEQTVETGHEIVSQTVDGMVTMRQAILEVAEKVNRLNQPAQKLAKVVDLVSNIASQLKLQAMNIKLATSRTNNECQEFISIAEKVLTLTQQLEAEIVEINPLVAKIQAETQAAVVTIEVGVEEAIAKTQLLEETQQKLTQIAAFGVHMILLVKEIGQVAANQTQASTSASQAILEVASFASKTSEQSMAVAESFSHLAAVAHEL